MKVLITGGAGFIGSHLAEAYIARGDEVVIVDNLVTGLRENVPFQAHFYELDICDPEFGKIIKNEQPDLISHHAAQTSLGVSTDRPEYDALENIIATIKVLSYAITYGVKRVIIVSSCAIFGEKKTQSIEQTGIFPISPYGISKLAGEMYANYFNSVEGAFCSIVRYSNVFGPRQNPKTEGGVIPIFINRALNNEPVMIFGDGNQERDFIYVDDVVRANMLVTDSPSTLDVTISNNQSITINELVDQIESVLQLLIEREFLDPRKGDIRISRVTSSKSLYGLGWKPEISFSEGLKKTVLFYKKDTSIL